MIISHVLFQVVSLQLDVVGESPVQVFVASSPPPHACRIGRKEKSAMKKFVVPFMAVVLSVACQQVESMQPCPKCPEVTERPMLLAIPIAEEGRQFVGFRIHGAESAPWVPKDFNQIQGSGETGAIEMMATGYVEGPTVFKVNVPSNIRKVDVEVGIPGAGGHRFSVTQP